MNIIIIFGVILIKPIINILFYKEFINSSYYLKTSGNELVDIENDKNNLSKNHKQKIKKEKNRNVFTIIIYIDLYRLVKKLK